MSVFIFTPLKPRKTVYTDMMMEFALPARRYRTAMVDTQGIKRTLTIANVYPSWAVGHHRTEISGTGKHRKRLKGEFFPEHSEQECGGCVPR